MRLFLRRPVTDPRSSGPPRWPASRAELGGSLLALTILVFAPSCTTRTVTGVDVGSVVVTPAAAALAAGEEVRFTAAVYDDEGILVDGAVVSWASGTPASLSIASDGMARALQPGSVVVSATFQGVSGSAIVTVLQGPVILTSPSTVALFGAVGSASPDPVVVQITNGGAGTLGGLSATVEYEEGGETGWLSAVLGGRTAPVALTLSAVTGSLPAGSHNATVVLESQVAGNSPVRIPVSFSVSQGAPIIRASPSTVTLYTSVEGQAPEPVSVQLTNGGVGDLGSLSSSVWYEGAPAREWLSGTLSGTEVPSQLIVSADPSGLPSGTYAGEVRVAAPNAVNSPQSVFVTFIVAAFTVTESGGGTTVSETGSTDDFTVVLGARPQSEVVFDVSSGDTGEVRTSPTKLTFTPADWDLAQTVTVTGVDDSTADGDQVTAVSVSVIPAESDDAFDPLPPQTVSVTNTDDDAAGFAVTETDGGTEVSEAGSTDVFTVVLTVQPSSAVAFTILSGDPGEATVSPPTLTFTPGNWSTPQTVTVTGVDDAVPDGDQLTTVTVSVNDGASDDSFDALPDQTVEVTTVDDDVVGFTIVETGTSTVVNESGTTDDFTVVLNTQPTTDVVLTLTGDAPTEATVAPASLIFTPGTWQQAQTVTVTGVDDPDTDGPQVSTVTVSVDDASSDDAYDPVPDQTVNVTTNDDETAGYTVAPGSLMVTEGSTLSFAVVLNAQPTSAVVMTVVSGNTVEATVDKASLTFSPSDWSTQQTVAVTAVDDALDDGDQVVVVTVSIDDGNSDDAYDPLPDQIVTVTAVDDDEAGFTVAGGPITVNEAAPGNTGPFTVVLDAEPASDVVLGVTSDDTGEATVSDAPLTFTPINWDVPQTVTVTGVDDVVDDGNQLSTVTVAVVGASSDAGYVDLPDQTVTVTTVDDDEAGFTIAETGAGTEVSESGTTDQFTVVLNSLPTSNVVLDVASEDTGEATVSPATLTFTPVNWDEPQTVTVTGVDDAIADGDQMTAVTVSVNDGASDDTYDPLPPQDVTVTTTDDETVGFTVTETDGGTEVSESGSTDGFTVVLDAEPASPVVFNVSSGDLTEAIVSPTPLTFLKSNWSTPQTVTVTGVNDDVADNDQVTTITVSVNDGDSDDAYDPLPDQTVTVTTVDDDAQGFAVTQSEGTTLVSESGTTDQFTVVLSSQPTTDVVLTVTGDAPAEATVAPTSLTFTPGTWEQAQTVTVTGVDDAVLDGDQETTVTISVDDPASDDTFDPLPDQTVTVTIIDDEVASFTVTESAILVTEDVTSQDHTGSFDVVLDIQPASAVVFDITTDDPTAVATVDVATLEFTPTDWDKPQTVTVTGVDDPIIDGSQSTTVTVSVNDAASMDPFDPLADQTVAVTTVDDEVASFTVSETTLEVSENAGTASFTVVLDGKPADPVSLLITVGDPGEAVVSKASLTFKPGEGNPEAWSKPQSVTVTGVDDTVVDGDQSFVVTVAVDDANSSDPFDGLSEQVGVITQDDEVAGYTVSGGSLEVSEDGGTTGTFTVVIDGPDPPETDVVFTVTSGDETEATVDKPTLTFTPGSWGTAQTVTVTGVDDVIVDGNKTFDVTVSVNDGLSNDAYDLLPNQTVSITTLDDDEAGFTVDPTALTVAEGATVSFTVVLDARPVSNVVFSVSSNDPTVATASPPPAFTPETWSTPQTVTVTGVDDGVVGPSRSAIITIAVDTDLSDSAFDGLAPQQVNVTVNDAAALAFNQGIGSAGPSRLPARAREATF